MTDEITLTLEPSGKQISVKQGTPLQEVLFQQGVEFPCGGQGTCQKCKVKVLKGNLAVNKLQQRILGKKAIKQGWRLACQCQVMAPLILEVEQWELAILSDETELQVTPEAGLGIAVDLGTTTLVAQLIDMQNGQILNVKTARNPQARYGADIMSRINYALDTKQGKKLTDLIRSAIGKLLAELLQIPPEKKIKPAALKKVNIVGNTAMHHLFCGLDITPLSRYPFQPEHLQQVNFNTNQLHWSLPGNPEITFLPCLGGFVGSDILAGILATQLHTQGSYQGLIDLGTNGEILFGNQNSIICASTAAGPAFEGAKITMGMSAIKGAVAGVSLVQDHFQCRIIGQAKPRGICGSGLVDAIATALQSGKITSFGKINNSQKSLSLCPPVKLTQADIREMQLAKGAIAAGIQILLHKLDIVPRKIEKIHLAGAFGNYINLDSARQIGLLDFDSAQMKYAGNTALQGAKMSLFKTVDHHTLLKKVKHISLASDPRFQTIFAENMTFTTS